MMSTGKAQIQARVVQQTKRTHNHQMRKVELEPEPGSECRVGRALTGNKVDDPHMEEQDVRDPRVLRLPAVHGAARAAIEVHLRLLLQQWHRCLALAAGHTFLYLS